MHIWEFLVRYQIVYCQHLLEILIEQHMRFCYVGWGNAVTSVGTETERPQKPTRRKVVGYNVTEH
jgi:hypothetical protein